MGPCAAGRGGTGLGRGRGKSPLSARRASPPQMKSAKASVLPRDAWALQLWNRNHGAAAVPVLGTTCVAAPQEWATRGCLPSLALVLGRTSKGKKRPLTPTKLLFSRKTASVPGDIQMTKKQLHYNHPKIPSLPANRQLSQLSCRSLRREVTIYPRDHVHKERYSPCLVSPEF